ncbi:MAG TPA: hypothetical protein VG370_04325, partial [Chloroflexota bacterium]|nr:hypothetical protein [Chloroflexota bacterium]
RIGASASQLVNRYVKEGLRMDEQPSVGFVTAPNGERVPVLAGRPRLKLVDVIGTWRAERRDAAATARYFGITEDDVQAVLRYYAAHRDELDAAVRAHLAAQDNVECVIRQRNARAARRAADA